MIWKVIAGMAAAFIAAATGSAEGQIGQGAYQVAIVGDSLATGAGIGQDRSYPGVIQQLALNERWPIRITVHAANGETTADGLGRMNAILQEKPDVIVLALGANDGLRSVTPEEVQRNLQQMTLMGLQSGAQVVLAGMEAPPNASTDYRIRFRAAFSGVARSTPVWFMPFLLDGVALNPSLNQADGVHPNEIGARRIAQKLWPYVTAAVARAATETSQR